MMVDGEMDLDTLEDTVAVGLMVFGVGLVLFGPRMHRVLVGALSAAAAGQAGRELVRTAGPVDPAWACTTLVVMVGGAMITTWKLRPLSPTILALAATAVVSNIVWRYVADSEAEAAEGDHLCAIVTTAVGTGAGLLVVERPLSSVSTPILGGFACVSGLDYWLHKWSTRGATAARLWLPLFFTTGGATDFAYWALVALWGTLFVVGSIYQLLSRVRRRQAKAHARHANTRSSVEAEPLLGNDDLEEPLLVTPLPYNSRLATSSNVDP